jgi:hypothetical protein
VVEARNYTLRTHSFSIRKSVMRAVYLFTAGLGMAAFFVVSRRSRRRQRVTMTNAASAFAYKNYRAVPGITSEELAAIGRLRRQFRQGFTCGQILSTELFWQVDGEYGGFGARFCDWLSQFFGIPFQPAIYDSLLNLTGDLDAGALDFAWTFTPMSERQKKVFDDFAHRGTGSMLSPAGQKQAAGAPRARTVVALWFSQGSDHVGANPAYFVRKRPNCLGG